MNGLWKKKLAAWLHDPAEKALVLMRDDVGHEHGSVKALREQLGINGADFDKRADWFAAAADRPQWPCEPGRMRPAWANVRFANQPLLIHPLSGEEIDIGSLDDIAAKHIRTVSLDHFSDLIERDAHGEPDLRLTYLAFWRFGPEPALVAPEIGDLWRVLPADTRVPDHSIWTHLDTVSALTGALTDDAPALLSMSFGPVQGFIAQARSTSDLWAGSHLLSSLVWEGLKVICAALGPDAIAFPSLRGVAAVDRWLLEVADAAGRGDQWRRRFTTIDAEWLQRTTDANPLFAATLPNKFMAIVPARQAEQLARQVVEAVREAARAWAAEAAQHVLDDRDQGQHWQEQLDSQLAGFPEAQWAIAEWPTGSDRDACPMPIGYGRRWLATAPTACSEKKSGKCSTAKSGSTAPNSSNPTPASSTPPCMNWPNAAWPLPRACVPLRRCHSTATAARCAANGSGSPKRLRNCISRPASVARRHGCERHRPVGSASARVNIYAAYARSSASGRRCSSKAWASCWMTSRRVS
jgi:hypothetical protein